MHGGTASHRFVPSRSGLEAFFRRYEEERARGGMSATLLHVTPRQRVDTIVLILGLNASSGWNRMGSESAESLWLRYATPLLAETREQAAALAIAAAAGLPGVFVPTIGSGTAPAANERAVESVPSRFVRSGGNKAAWKLDLAVFAERFRNAFRRDRRMQVGAAAALVALAVLGGRLAGLDAAMLDLVDTFIEEPVVDPVEQPSRRTGVIPHATQEPPLSDPGDPAGDAFRSGLSVTLAAALQHDGAVTPRALAEIFAGESDLSAEPEVFLGAMLRRWPAPPDRSLPRDGTGAQALLDYAAAFAAIESGKEAAVLPLDRSTPEDERLRDELARFAGSGEAGESRPVTFPAWPSWTRWLTFLPLLAVVAIAVLTFRRAVRASLVNPPEGAAGFRIDLPLDGLIRSAPKPERRLARSLAWREPAAGRGIDAERSVRATTDRGGFLTPVPIRRPHAAEYLFLIRRRGLQDHERDRVSRLVDALAAGGLSVHAYDYDPDPRSLCPRIAGEAAPPSLDLRGLRERHPEARLVLVSDGSELVDFFTLRPLPFVAGELSTWPARMLLTPVPMTEWGEREMNIVEALGGGIGRATVEGFRDLETAFGTRTRQRRPAAGRRVRGDAGVIQRVVDWLIDTERRLGGGDGLEARPAAIRLDDPFLRSEAPPPDESVGKLLRDLHAWLGSRGYLWLAACACYPQLRFAVTNYLGLKITLPYGALAVPLYSEELLAQLTLLPWFRSGHMPLWLRKALLGSLSRDAHGRVRQAIDQLLHGNSVLPAGQALPRDARLPIWRPEAEGLEIPPDEVMADLVTEADGGEGPALRGEALDRILGPHRQKALAQRGGALFMTAVWCAVAWWLWPDPAAAPHPQGAWLPLVAYCLFTLLAFLAALVLRRWRHLRLTARGGARSLAGVPAR